MSAGIDGRREPLEQGARALGVQLSEQQIDQLLAYAGLLGKWNGAYNLTAVRDPNQVLTHHLLDSLSLVTPLRRHMDATGARTLLDVGSGGGLPGVVLAICFPALQVRCLDAVAKKIAFVRQVAAALKLKNLQALHQRVESAAGEYDVVTSRAFASLRDFVTLSQHLLTPAAGAWVAMKGKSPDAEIAELPDDVEVFHVEQLQVPGLDADRCLVWMRRRAA